MNELEKLSKRLSELSFMLGSNSKFSPDVDSWLNEYEYGGMEDRFSENPSPEEINNLKMRANKILQSHKEGTLEIKNARKRQIIQIRGKKGSKSPKRKPVKKCKCK